MQMNAALCQGHTCVSATSPIQQIKGLVKQGEKGGN